MSIPDPIYIPESSESYVHNHPTILFIGGNPDTTKPVRAVLEEEKYRVTYRQFGSEGIAVLAEGHPSLVLICLAVSDMDGVELCRSVRAAFPDPILAISANQDEDALVDALDSGADDVLGKTLRLDELRARVRALLRRSSSMSSIVKTIQCGGLHIDSGKRKVTLNGKMVVLTRTEFDILFFLALHRDEVQSQESILNAVWGRHHGQYVQTLRVHVGHIRQKIEADPGDPEYVLTEPGIGYSLVGPRADRAAASHRLYI